MSGVLRYLSHPQVAIDSDIPVPQWKLSEIGKHRVMRIAGAPVLRTTTRIVSSGETKAIETARIMALELGLDVEIDHAMGENDRSATGFLPPAEFQEIANRFFSEPHISVRGWERAIDAQIRIVQATIPYLKAAGQGDILLVGHGGVGTLLYCHFADAPISRSFDQPNNGGGNYFTIAIDSFRAMHPWRRMEELLESKPCNLEESREHDARWYGDNQ